MPIVVDPFAFDGGEEALGDGIEAPIDVKQRFSVVPASRLER